MPTVEACGVLLLVGPLISRKKVFGEVAKVIIDLFLKTFFWGASVSPNQPNQPTGSSL
jgi:hypothetical protein